jgi:hypothetical protein
MSFHEDRVRRAAVLYEEHTNRARIESMLMIHLNHLRDPWDIEDIENRFCRRQVHMASRLKHNSFAVELVSFHLHSLNKLLLLLEVRIFHQDIRNTLAEPR